MRVAFVGKGGSGKSTLAALFFEYLLSQGRKTVCFDADLNIHVPQLLGLHFQEEKSLSLTQNARTIKQYLIGKSDRISSPDDFYKTTPPSTGTNSFELKNSNNLIQLFFEPYKQGYIGVVGTYQADEIGRSCYHTNLAVFENLLSFAQLEENESIVADMVAGIDAFSNTLHAQFDLLVLIVEPSQEGIGVYRQYIELATTAGMQDRLFVVGNKIEDETDLEFLTTQIDRSQILGTLNNNRKIKHARQNNSPLSLDLLTDPDLAVLSMIKEKAVELKQDPAERLQILHQLHTRYIAQDYVRNASGDLSHQIDPSFVR